MDAQKEKLVIENSGLPNGTGNVREAMTESSMNQQDGRLIGLGVTLVIILGVNFFYSLS